MKPLLTVFFIITSSQLKAQATTDSTAASDLNMIYDIVDVAPEPIGGMEAFYETVLKNLKYPADAREKNITGKVIVQFVVEKDGKLLRKNVKVTSPVHKSLDKEAIRIVLLTSPWKPGTLKGQRVRTRKALPITFSLKQSNN